MDLNDNGFFEKERESKDKKYVREALKDQLCIIDACYTYDKEGACLCDNYGNKVAKVVMHIAEGEHEGEFFSEFLRTEKSIGRNGEEYLPSMLRYLILNTGIYIEDENENKIIPEDWAEQMKGKAVVVDFKKNENGYVKIEKTRPID